MSTRTPSRAVVLLSGGLDSATVAALARRDGHEVHALSFDYGQRHRVELDRASRLAAQLRLVEHKVVKIDLGAIGGSALTSRSFDVPKTEIDDAGGRSTMPLEPPVPAIRIPITYVPARNTVFLAVALGYAEVIGSCDIYFGANALDYSGYPDCRPAFVEAFERLASVATKAGVEGRSFRIRAPLMHLGKADIIRVGLELGVDFASTHSCYDPIEDIACGACESCRIRRAGFAAAGVSDPIAYAIPRETKVPAG